MPEEIVEYLSTSRLGERGTMTLPKEYRDALHLEAGAPVSLVRIGDGLLLIPEQKRFEQICESLAKRLADAGISEAALQATLPEVREQLTRERYPELFAETPAKPKSLAKSNRP
ncbi:MAG TPA: AbrB/MazE/SpoVT family DNA-binding domain-containing protein [Bryobacteraceae bacterium]|jgi:AbrB family looped-hinge helix DNA binding protein